MKHKHRWRPLYRSGIHSIGFGCNCGKAVSRPLTDEEIILVKADQKQSAKETKEMHHIYHDFSKTFQSKKRDKGYTLIEKVRKWAIQYPTVQISRCDDQVHAGSDLVFIPHESKCRYMGTTVVYIPQCTGEGPTEFFLYPAHTDSLIKVLQKIKDSEKSRREPKNEHWTKFKYRSK